MLLLSKDRKAILNSCEYGEDVVVDTYDKALKNDFEHLGVEQRNMIQKQRELIKADHNEVKELRDQLVEQE